MSGFRGIGREERRVFFQLTPSAITSMNIPNDTILRRFIFGILCSFWTYSILIVKILTLPEILIAKQGKMRRMLG